MSYCYVTDKLSDQTSLQNHYQDLMPESPIEHKLSSNNSTTSSHISSNMSPNTQLEHEKRVRREIANSNERRRMQSINTGFQTLKILIPHSCGEKLSKACILQRAADHIKTLENEKIKLQSQNEQFRILIKSFQIDSTSILQGQRRLSTNDPDESNIPLGNIEDPQSTGNPNNPNVYDDVKPRHTYWHAQYVQSPKDDQSIDKYYRTIKQSTSSTTAPSDTTYMIVKQSQPSQRCYKTNSLDQNNDNGIVIVERCQLRAQSVDTNNTVSRRNLQTIVEAIRHLEGDDVLANINQSQQTSSSSLSSSSSHHSHQQKEDLPAQIKAMINEKFQQTNNKNPSSPTSSSNNNTIYQQTLNIYDQQQQPPTSYDIDLHQKPPKKRKITYNDTNVTTIQKQDLPPISSPEVHHHEQISSESSPPSPVGRLLQEHLRQHTLRCPPH